MAYFYTCVAKKRYSEIYFTFHKNADELRQDERNSAIKIQSWFRSLKVQKHIEFLHTCAVMIQKTYRAYVTRKLYRGLIQNLMAHLMKEYYDIMATKIQAQWRGYFIRKYRANYYTRKEYLQALVLKNELVTLHLKEVDEINKFNKEIKIMENGEAARLYSHRKMHYLLSTKVCHGIYNSPINPNPHEESALLAAKPLSSAERVELKCKKWEKYLRTATGIPSDNQGDHENIPMLPPIKGSKPQGPFRTPEEVQKQRYKELLPSLRVATDYQSVEEARSQLHQDEWTKRIIDQAFLPSSKQAYKYQATLHTSSSYGRLDYGTKHFRDEQAVKDIHTKPFQRVVSPIPFFDQLGKTY